MSPKLTGVGVGCTVALLLLWPALRLSAQPQPSARTLEARAAYESGELERAVELFQNVARESSTLDADRIEAFETLAAIARGQGRSEDAIEWADRTIDAARRSGDGLAEGEALNTRGLAAYALGRLDQAITDLEASLAVHRTAGHSWQEVIRLSNLGGLAQLRDRYFEAQRYYEQALARLDEEPSAPWAAERRAIAVANLASLYQRIGRYEKALDLYLAAAGQAAVAVTEQVALDDGERAQLLANMGALYRRLGDPYKAVEAYAQAAELAARAGDAARGMSLGINRGIALALDLGRLSVAEAAFVTVRDQARGSGSLREELHATLYLAETRRRLGRSSEAAAGFGSALAQADVLGVAEERWKALYGLGRIAEDGGDEAGAERLYRQSIDGVESLRSRLQNDSLRRSFLADRGRPYEALVALLLSSPRADPSCGDRAFCSELLGWIGTQRAQTLGERPSRSGSGESAELSSIRDQLVKAWKRRLEVAPEQRAALDLQIERLESEYRRAAGGAPVDSIVGLDQIQRGLDPNAALLVSWAGPESLLRMWVTSQSASYQVSSYSEQERRAVRRYAEAVADPDSDWELPAAEAGRILLGDEASQQLEDLSLLLVSQDPSLAAAPLEATIPPGFSEPLLRSVPIAYVPRPEAPRRERQGLSWPWTETLAAFAYSQPEPDSGLPVLAMAETEAREIARLLPGSRHVFGEVQADRAALEQMLKAPPAIWHFASHAVLDEERPELSRLLLAPNAEDSSNPESVLLAEIERWDLEGVRLAVLSACDTARGRQVEGAGVRSLSGAFLDAGADSVVAGLWRVPDRETAALMGQFYYWLGRGADRAEALREAKVGVAGVGGASHPYYWAGFRLTTRAVGPVVRGLDRLLWLTLAGIAVGALGWLGLRLRRRGTVASRSS